MNAKDIIKNGHYDAGDDLEIAISLDRMAGTATTGDAVLLRDAAIDIRSLIRIVHEFSKLHDRKLEDGIVQKLYKLDDVIAITRISNSSIYRMARIGEFPSPIKIGERSSAWIKDEVDQWIIMKIKNRE